MRRLVFALLIGLAPAIASAQGSVNLSVCNAGKVDVDVFLSREGRLSSSHIGPADCATIAEGTGAMATAYLGFAFVDSQGRWGAARRFNVDNVTRGPDGMTQASQSALVRRGNANVSLPMQWLFAPGGNNPPSSLVGEPVLAQGVVRRPQRCGGRIAELESGVELQRTRYRDVIGELGGGIPTR